MTIQDFRATPLPDRIIHALLEATQAYAEMDVLLNEYTENRPVLSHMLFALDMYYSFYDLEPDIDKIYHSLFVSDKTSETGKAVETLKACMEFAKERALRIDVLTAGDLLRIDNAIKSADMELPALEIPLLNVEQHVETMWSILHDFYDPQQQYPLLLETAIACYRLLALPGWCNLSLQTLRILFSTVYQRDVSFSGLLRQWILLTDPRTHISFMNIEDVLVHILDVFRGMWTYTTALIRALNQRNREIVHLVHTNFPQLASASVDILLSESLCIRNHDISGVSPKTVIKYLKQLEQEKILYSIKSGREIFYFNNLLADVLRQQI